LSGLLPEHRLQLGRGLNSLAWLYVTGITRLRLGVDVNAEIGQSKRLGLGACCTFEEVVDEYDGRVTRLGESNPVAHGAGGAGPSGTYTDQHVVGLL
jgi:hypothetical protein